MSSSSWLRLLKFHWVHLIDEHPKNVYKSAQNGKRFHMFLYDSFFACKCLTISSENEKIRLNFQRHVLSTNMLENKFHSLLNSNGVASYMIGNWIKSIKKLHVLFICRIFTIFWNVDSNFAIS